MKTKHMLMQKSWSSGSFLISRMLFIFWYFFLQQTVASSKATGGKTHQPLTALQGGQQAGPSPMEVSGTGL